MPAMDRLARTLNDYIRLRLALVAECPDCQRRVELSLRGLAAKYGGYAMLRTIRPRLVCSVCPPDPARQIEIHPRRDPEGGPIPGAFGGAYEDATQPTLMALEGPMRRNPRGKWR